MEIIDYLIPLLIGSSIHLILNYILRITIKFPDEYKKIEKKKLKQEKINQFLSNYTCILHAIIMTIYGFYATVTTELNFKKPLSDMDTKFYLFSIGYNIYDIIYEHWAGLININYLIHHLIVILMNGHSIYLNKNSSVINFIFFIGELTNPFICLHKNFYFYPNLKKISDLLGFIFCILFLLIRVGICTFLMYYGNGRNDISYFVNFFANIMVYIGYQWSFEVFNKMLKTLDGKGGPNGVYARFREFRQRKNFGVVFHAVLFLVCFIPFVFNSHDDFI